MQRRAIVLHRNDNVATAVSDLEAGEHLDLGGITLDVSEAVPFGHKIALTSIRAGGEVLKYGECIGLALQDIPAGGCVHIHNVESRRGRGDREGAAQ